MKDRPQKRMAYLTGFHRKGHAISAGDVVRALRMLDARDEATRAAIARVLGYELEKPRKRHQQKPHDSAVVPSEPLFNPQWTRAMISTLARIRTRTGPPDIENLVAAAAEQKPMLTLDLSIAETASGADVLVDVGENMSAFSGEQAQLVDMMRRVLGRGFVSTYRFTGSPERGVLAESMSDFEEYRPARHGWPVVALTDLGIGTGSEAALAPEWVRFSRLVQTGGCHLLALVPYPPRRWPAALASSMHIIHWDRATSVRTIKTMLRGVERNGR